MSQSNFNKTLEKILSQGKTTNLREDQRDSPTRVHPEHGLEVNKGVEGTSEPDAAGPVKSGVAPASLKTNPGNTTAGPMGHIPTNSDLPRPQHDGLDTNNKSAGTGHYELHTEESDSDEDKDKMDEAKDLPPWLKKKDVKESDSDEDSDAVNEDKDADSANDKAGYTDAMKGKGGDKFDEETGKAEKFDEAADEKEDKKAVEEALNALLKGEKLSEAFKEKTATIFEATLSKRLKENRKKLKEKFTKKLNERVLEIREDLSSKVDGHLDLVVENWVKTNEVALTNSIKFALAEEFIGGLKDLLEEHYIEIPAEKVDVVSEMVNRLAVLENKLNESIANNVALVKQNKLYERNVIFDKVTKGLSVTQISKLRGLAENVDFKNTKQYESAVNVLKESVNTTSTNSNSTVKNLSEQVLDENPLDQSAGKNIDAVKDMLGRMARN